MIRDIYSKQGGMPPCLLYIIAAMLQIGLSYTHNRDEEAPALGITSVDEYLFAT